MKTKNPILDEAVELYKTGLSTLKVVKITSIKIGMLTRELNKLGVMRSNKENSRRYQVDHNYFDTINNEAKAYWLGFCYADGYVTSKKGKEKSFGIALSIKDESHLEKFKMALSATYPIKRYTADSWGVPVKYCRLLMRSDRLFDALEAAGAVQRKSLILAFPKEIIPASLLHHFMRGYFDGDGSFAKSSDGFFAFKLCGTKEFLTDFADLLGYRDVKLYRKRKSKKNNWYISISGRKQVKKIGDFLYKESSIFLHRKRGRYLKLS